MRVLTTPLLALLALLVVGTVARAADPTPGELKLMADTVWVMMAGMLVFFMNLGFGCVESGFCRAKNCVNILSKNFIVFATASIAFWVAGFGLMFGDGNVWFGQNGVFFVSGGADKEAFTKDVAIAAIKDKVKEVTKIDLSDEETAKKEEELLKAIDEQAAAAAEKVVKAEESATVTVTAAGKSIPITFEGKDYYWDNYSSIAWTSVPIWAKFFFQLVFAGTAATIVSGAVAERIKYHSFILFVFFLTIFIYPIIGHWIWGGGLLAVGKDNLFGAEKGVFDFAGSTVVHSVGGWAALAGVLVLGPRIGKYGPDGKANAIPGHNMTAAFIGCLVLWFGWFGFNPGSTMAADVNAISRIAVTTNTAAAFAILTSTITAWIFLGKPDIGMTLNGCLAGLVAITAPCAFVTTSESAIIGALAGVIVVLSVIMFDKVRIDDPVGATSVHLVNGIFGTIAVGLWGHKELISNGTKVATGLANDGLLIGGTMDQFLPQVIGVGVVALYVFPASIILWLILKYTVGIRVSPQEEMEGLDIGEHGNEAYHGFIMGTAGGEAVSTAITEPRSASKPPNGKRFTVVLEGANPNELKSIWSDLCQTGASPPPADFLAVYPLVTTMQGNRFTFRGGDSSALSGKLSRVIESRSGGKRISARVEV